MLLGKPR